MERLLPQSTDAEEALLGSILLDPECMVQVADTITAADFYRTAHKLVYEAILALYKQREPADYITLCDELAQKGQLEDAGGIDRILSLVNSVPTSANARYYAGIVARKAEHRRMIHVAGRIAALAYEETENALEEAERLLFAVKKRRKQGGFVSLASIMGEYMNELELLTKNKGAIIGVPTGFTPLDKLTGGLQRTDLIILGGRPGSGKTSLALNIAVNGAEHYQKRIAMYSIEMGARQLARRLMSMMSKVDMQRLRQGWFDDDWQTIVDAHGKLSDLPIWINDTMGSPITSMRGQIRQLIAEVGSIDLVIVDYLQLIEPEEDGDKRGNRVRAIDEISRGLKAIAREFDVPVLALASLSREVEKRQNKIPVLADLRESGGIESDADVVMFVYRDDYYAEMEQRQSARPNIADIIVAKHRQGPTGALALYFQKELTRFLNLDERRQPYE